MPIETTLVLVKPDGVRRGLCGEVAHAAVLCPSFYETRVVRNPTAWERAIAGLRSRVIGLLQGA